MADDFKALIAAQKETTRQLMNDEERAEDDRRKEEQHQVRVQAGRKAWETRQEKNQEETEKNNELQITFLGNIKTGFTKFFTGGSKAAEMQARNERQIGKLVNGIKTMSGYLKGIAMSAVARVKSGLGGLGKFAIGALALAVLAFLNSPKMMALVSTFIDDIIPKLAFILDKYIIPFAKLIKNKLVKVFKDTLAVFKGEKGIVEYLKENYKTLIALSAILAPGLFFGTLKVGLGLLLKGISLAWSASKIGTFLKLPAVTTALGLGLIVSGLIDAIGDGFDEWTKSKDVSKTIAAGLAGKGKGMDNAIQNAKKWAKLFGGFGLAAFGPIGGIIGGAIGAVLGGFLGYFGKEAVDKALNNILEKAKGVWSGIVSIFTNLFLSLKKFLGFELEKEQEASLNDFNKLRNDANKKRRLKELDSKVEFAAKDVAEERKDVKLGNLTIFAGEGADEIQRDKNKFRFLKEQRSRLKSFEGSISDFNLSEKQLKKDIDEDLDRRDGDIAKENIFEGKPQAKQGAAMPMVINSGNTVTNNETIAPTLVNGINMTDSDPFIKSFANAKDFSFG